MTRTQSPVAWLRSEALEGTQRLCKRNVSEGELNSELHSELQAKCKRLLQPAWCAHDPAEQLNGWSNAFRLIWRVTPAKRESNLRKSPKNLLNILGLGSSKLYKSVD